MNKNRTTENQKETTQVGFGSCMLVLARCCFVLVLLLVPLCFIGVFWLCSLLLYLFMLVLVLFFPGKPNKTNKYNQETSLTDGRFFASGGCGLLLFFCCPVVFLAPGLFDVFCFCFVLLLLLFLSF